MLELEVMASIRIPKTNTALPKSVDSGTDRGGSGTDSIACDSAGARDEPKGRTAYGQGPAPHLAGKRQRLQPQRRAGRTRDMGSPRILHRHLRGQPALS